ncbi:MAG: L-aspartate oxidase [Pseudomonadota bacterium]
MKKTFRSSAGFRPFEPSATSGTTGDIVIIGAGLAGLFAALKLSPLPVTVVSAAPLGEGASSAWAQGGIAAAVGFGDTPKSHTSDTIKAGGGLVDEAVAHTIAAEAPDRIADLLRYHVPFDRDLQGHFVLSREAAHSEKRVVRVTGDRAGHAIMQALIATVRKTPSIRVLEGFAAEDLIMSDGAISGVRLMRTRLDGDTAYELVPANAVILATGGLSGLFAATTNPEYARGEGIGMAARAGATIADPEFVQFHPTALDVAARPTPLATEALRGEGATLVNKDGRRFMPAIHDDAEMAPRDIVARAVFEENASGRGSYLDCREAIGADFKVRFPTVYAHCQRHGLDPETDLLPVTPAAHYHMGGIATDLNARTDVPGLWAIGEVAATGLHGANRLASNSLLEATVMAARAAGDIASATKSGDLVRAELRACPASGRVHEPARIAILTEIGETLSEKAGVVRNGTDLESAQQTIGNALAIAKAADDTALINASLAAAFLITAALPRHESRGGHHRSDYPEIDEALQTRTFITLDDVETSLANVCKRETFVNADDADEPQYAGPDMRRRPIDPEAAVHGISA